MMSVDLLLVSVALKFAESSETIAVADDIDF